MPDDRGRLYIADIAAELNIAESDWRARVSRGHAPDPDDVVAAGGVARPVWDRETIEGWRARPARRGPRPTAVAE